MTLSGWYGAVIICFVVVSIFMFIGWKYRPKGAPKTITGKIMSIHLVLMLSIIFSLSLARTIKQSKVIDEPKVLFTTMDNCEYIYIPDRHLYTCKNHIDSKIPNIIWTPYCTMELPFVIEYRVPLYYRHYLDTLIERLR